MFVDTSGLFSLYDSHDAFHPDAARAFREAEQLLTHSYVLAELVALAGARKLPRREALLFIRSLLDHPLLEILWVDEAFHRAGMESSERRLDKGYSLCDAVSFLQMRERGVAESLTTDRHFEQEGFVRLLKS
jgi:predicted nucleic acid-binding protein